MKVTPRIILGIARFVVGDAKGVHRVLRHIPEGKAYIKDEVDLCPPPAAASVFSATTTEPNLH